jgi:hypothetical protein
MGLLLKLKCAQSPLNLRILSSTSVPFTLTAVQVPNLAQTHTKRITVQYGHCRFLERRLVLYVLAGNILFLKCVCEGSRLQQLSHNNDHNSKDDDENRHSGGGTASAAGRHISLFCETSRKTCFRATAATILQYPFFVMRTLAMQPAKRSCYEYDEFSTYCSA